VNIVQRHIFESISIDAGFSAGDFDRLWALHALLSTKSCPVNYFALLDAALKHPLLLDQKPATIDRNVERSAAFFGIAKARVIDAALKHPPLVSQRPETLNRNLERAAALLGVARERFIAAALKKPQLFTQKPETLNSNVLLSAAFLGVTKGTVRGGGPETAAACFPEARDAQRQRPA
jgi:hypothetical protein